ncbi:cytochrome c [Alphaproteobacteria bacterium LSUCC0684]
MKFPALITLTFSLVLGLSTASADVIGERKANFRKNVDALKAINTAIPEGDHAAVAAAASVVANWSRDMTAFFPKGSDEGDTKARPEIWMEWEKFVSLAKNAEDSALALAQLAKAGNAEALPGALNTLGASCKACHNSFKY